MNIHNYFTMQFGKLADIDGSMNPYYELLGNEYICWRSILYIFAIQYLSLSSRLLTIVAKSGQKYLAQMAG